jgi:UDP-N-acetylglucosamine/UDP-N-acetylgalactosamine diphosphorylase
MVVVTPQKMTSSNVYNTSALKKIEKFRQQHPHIFNFELNPEEAAYLQAQLAELPEPEVLKRLFDHAMKTDSSVKTDQDSTFKPLEKSAILKASQESESGQRWYRRGLEALKAGECAVVTLAGGQGTRLGSSAPKGCYSIGLPSGASLFQIQAERILKVQEIAGMTAPLSWFIMTSQPTHKDTVDFFKRNNFFGLESNQVTFFNQGLLPAFDLHGNLLLTSKGRLSVAPDGNGGIYKALDREGLLKQMISSGIKYVHMYCVDNCLVKVGDPSFIGACIEVQTDCAAKCVEKTDPCESVGIFCRRAVDDRMIVAEYSELEKSVAESVDPESGKLLFGEANIANHFFTVEFLEKLLQVELPYHVARKKIPSIDPKSGETTTTSGIKLEAFIFDVFELAEKPILFEVPRLDEFAPLKNASGTPKDSPEYCARLLFDLHRRYLTASGAELLEGDYEISSLLTYEGEGLEKFSGMKLYPGLIQ